MRIEKRDVARTFLIDHSSEDFFTLYLSESKTFSLRLQPQKSQNEAVGSINLQE